TSLKRSVHRQPASAKWYDRRDYVFVEFCVEDSKDVNVNFEKSKLTFSCLGGSDNFKHLNEIDLFNNIDPNESKHKRTDRSILCCLRKGESGQAWPRLTKERAKVGLGSRGSAAACPDPRGRSRPALPPLSVTARSRLLPKSLVVLMCSSTGSAWTSTTGKTGKMTQTKTCPISIASPRCGGTGPGFGLPRGRWGLASGAGRARVPAELPAPTGCAGWSAGQLV
uniref:Prostaglandin E synthase 3 n=1 Tax=Otus sunia TaxID=257818 RepID=A0A8C8E840_9STRI